MANLRLLHALLLALVVCWSACARAQADLRVSRLAGEPGSVPAMLAGDLDDRFIAVDDAVLRPQPTASGWYRVESSRDWPADRQPMLVLRTWTASRLALWRPGHAQALQRETMGAHADLGFSASLLTLPLRGGLRAGEPLYLQVSIPDFAAHVLAIEPEQELRVRDQRWVRGQSLVNGALLALALAGLGMGMALRERSLLLLAGALGLSLLYVLAGSGEFYRWPLLSSLAADLRSPLVFAANGASLMIALFVRHLLDMPRNTPRLARLQWVTLAVFGLGMANTLLFGIGASARLWAQIGNLNIVASSLLLLAACVLRVRAGDRSIRLLLWSLLPLMVLALWRVGEVLAGRALNPTMAMLFTLSFLFLGTILFIGLVERMLQYKRERDAADTLARHDPLTAAYNRRALDERLQAAELESRRADRPLALLFADIDHFKRVNDEHGHDAGDECLREVARRIHSSLRIGDFFGRYGGEEFVVGLPGMSVEDARGVGERIRQNIAAEPVRFAGRALPLTISIGVAGLQREGESIDAALKRADQALYASKQQGRDRVSVL